MKNLLTNLMFLISFSNLYSQNGWYQQYSSPYKINDIYFLNENTGWACGDSGFVAKTTNAGLNWVGQYSPIRVCYKSVHFINENTGWVGGGDDYILSTTGILNTTNGGANWYVLVYSGGYSTVSSVQLLNKDTAFVAYAGNGMFSTEGGFVRTTNNGVNWQSPVSGMGSYQFSGIHFINKLTGWVLAFFGNDTGRNLNRIMKTSDGGSNWTIQFKDSLQAYSPLKQIKFVNNLTGFAVGYGGRLLKTTNGGENWISKNMNTSRNLVSVSFINENTGWIGAWKYGDTSSVLKTTDGGETWVNLVNSYSVNQAFKIHFVNSLTGWACGDFTSGKIMKTITGGLTEVKIISTEFPDKFSLSQNYPNPFNPLTRINYELQITNYVILNVYDVNGRLLKELVNEKQSVGNYSIDFDGSGLPSGTYIYRLRAGDFSETKKMVLIK